MFTQSVQGVWLSRFLFITAGPKETNEETIFEGQWILQGPHLQGMGPSDFLKQDQALAEALCGLGKVPDQKSGPLGSDL